MKLTKQTWFSLITIGLVGQFAWTIENMYFNVFLYNTITTDPSFIALMVAASAIAATVTTLFMGELSDKVGKRKLFISIGYIMWGISTFSFRFVTVDNAAKLFPSVNAAFAAAVSVVALDCIMTFFGSTANDAAFNAYITDITDEGNRGRVESVLATLPLISMLVIFGLFDKLTQQGKWAEFFTIFGLSVTVCGLISLLFLKESAPPKKDSSYINDILYGFKLSVIGKNKKLYTALAAAGIFAICVQIFFPYLIIYIQNYLKIDSYAVVLGIVLIFASVVSVASGKFIDKVGKLNFVLPSAAVMFAGLVAMYFARGMAAVIIAGSVMMSGYMLVTAVLSAIVRDYTPPDKTGMFQGIRMIFTVLLPMLIGPFIGAAVIKNSAETYVDLGVVKSVPTPAIFLASAAALIFVVLPVMKLKKSTADNAKEDNID